MGDLEQRIIWNIGRLLKERNMSQAALARLVEMDPAQLNPYLKGHSKFPLWLAESIAQKLEVTFEALLNLPASKEAEALEALRLKVISLCLSADKARLRNAALVLTEGKASAIHHKKPTAG
jgi:transcriptional regulator with XRE-family HTH domain